MGRSDGNLPLGFDGWTRAGECFKQFNSQAKCYHAKDCVNWKWPYCFRFPEDRSARDLISIVYYKMADPNEQQYTFTTDNQKAMWATMTAVKGSYIDLTDPVRYLETESCDGIKPSAFPSIADGRQNDILLLSMAFDDYQPEQRFRPPPGTDGLAYVGMSDEAGTLYTKKLTEDGPTGVQITEGYGGSECKDILISLTLRHP